MSESKNIGDPLLRGQLIKRSLFSSGTPSKGCIRVGQSHEAPIHIVDNDFGTTCDIHGWCCANAYYNPFDISAMIEEGHVDCPLCLEDMDGSE